MASILFLTPQLPFPARQGTALRNWGLIRHLAPRHALTLLSFADEGQSADAPELRAVCRRVVTVPAPRRSPADRLRTLLSPNPDLARRLWSPDFDRALARLLREADFDIAHVEGLEMAAYLPTLREAARAPRLVYDAHNAEHVLQARAFASDSRQPARWIAAAYSWVQMKRLRQFETQVCRSVDCVVCVSEEDAQALKRLVPGLAPAVVPNGIDLEAYRGAAPGPAGPAVSFPIPTESRGAGDGVERLVFTGKMDYRPNWDAALWFARDILPRIRAARPEARFVVAGQKPPNTLLKLNGSNGVVVTGAMDDVRPLIAGAAVYVAPLRLGGGTRFKLLEAMALARPVVSTTLGAEGFAVRSGRELLLADAPADFAAAVLALLSQPAQAERLGRAGRSFVEAGYDWRAIIPRLEAAYRAA